MIFTLPLRFPNISNEKQQDSKLVNVLAITYLFRPNVRISLSHSIVRMANKPRLFYWPQLSNVQLRLSWALELDLLDKLRGDLQPTMLWN